LSKVIKESIALDSMVVVGDTHEKTAVLSDKQIKKNTRISLDFNGRIDLAIEELQKKIEGHVALIEKSRGVQIDEMCRQNYKKGYDDGLKQEHADRDDYIDRCFSDRIKVIESLLAEARKKKDDAFRGLEENIIMLAVSISEKIINKSIEINHGIVEATVTDAMSHVVSSETLILKVSADDYEIINAHYDKWLNMTGNVKEFRIEIDKRLNSGDCLIETEGEIIDASLSSRLDILTEELLKVNK